MSRARIEANVASLAKRLEQNPNDAEGWVMLATSYSSLEKFQEASDAFAKAVSLKSNDVDLLVDYAFALAMSNNRKLEGKPAEQLQKALQLDPENPRALQLAGAAAYEAHNYEQAITHWEKLIQKTPPDSELAQMLTQRIADAKAAAGRK
jgi:cytochrome c-type biogenesis protein CcmH